MWTLAHKSILTSENLRRKGREGPSRYPLCLKEEENIDHLLLACPFAKEVWDNVLKLGPNHFSLPTNIPDLLSIWANRSPFLLRQKVLLKTCWMWIPKFIMWKIWLKRNNRLFREESCNSIQVTNKVKDFLGETLESKTTLENLDFLDPDEFHWLKEFVPNHQHRKNPNPVLRVSWEVHLEEQDFIKWRSTLEEHCLFFDDASKGNPSVAGGGGILLGPTGMMEMSFAWGLGSVLNNRAEDLALWQGLRLAVAQNI